MTTAMPASTAHHALAYPVVSANAKRNDVDNRLRESCDRIIGSQLEHLDDRFTRQVMAAYAARAGRRTTALFKRVTSSVEQSSICGSVANRSAAIEVAVSNQTE